MGTMNPVFFANVLRERQNSVSSVMKGGRMVPIKYQVMGEDSKRRRLRCLPEVL